MRDQSATSQLNPKACTSRASNAPISYSFTVSRFPHLLETPLSLCFFTILMATTPSNDIFLYTVFDFNSLKEEKKLRISPYPE